MAQIFKEDELELLKIPKNTDEKTLLEMEGIAFLKDVAPILKIKPAHVIFKARELNNDDKLKAYKIMGVRKIFNHWVVRIKIFAPYFLEHFKRNIRTVNPQWDSNQLLAENGCFVLSEVCKKLPFSPYQIRHQAKKVKSSREIMGVWKDSKIRRFVVDMKVFRKWVQNTWQKDFGNRTRPASRP